MTYAKPPGNPIDPFHADGPDSVRSFNENLPGAIMHQMLYDAAQARYAERRAAPRSAMTSATDLRSWRTGWRPRSPRSC